LPDLRGEFIRGYDNGRAVDTGRVLGSSQTDTLQNITGEFATLQPDSYTNTGVFSHTEIGNALVAGASSVYAHDTVTFDASTQARTSTETRPRNIAMYYIIRT